MYRTQNAFEFWKSVNNFQSAFRRGAGGLLPPPPFASWVRESPEVARDNTEFYTLSNETYFEEIGPRVLKLLTSVCLGFK